MMGLTIMRLLFIIMALIFTASSTTASDKNRVFTSFGAGIRSCSAFVRDYDKNEWSKVVNVQWVNGYLTAFNKFIYDEEDVAESMDVTERERWIYNYCKNNPSKDLESATTELISHLLKLKR